MNIFVEKESDIFKGTPAENCVFCNKPTRLWATKFNRPVCKLCSQTNREKDIAKAKFNY